LSWYEDMAAAMRKREVAINGRERWQAKVDEAEAEIAALTQQNGSPQPAAEPTEPKVGSELFVSPPELVTE
jgi:hypothetical protein